jgi:spermidine synthase
LTKDQTLAPIETLVTQRPRRGLMIVFGTWSFLASLLIFWVELMVAKMLLPRFGGSASVWNTALVFFQVTLLIGYAVAHALARLDSRRHKMVQIALVAVPLLTLPVALPNLLESQSLAPTVAVLASLTIMIGAPFFALSTSTPTLQTWFSHSGHPRAADPYFLYALSNVGSLLGLVGYPLVVEPLLSIRGQSIAWTVGYALFVVTTVFGARLIGQWKPSRTIEAPPPPMQVRIRWAAIAFVPSLLLLGVTRHLSTDVAAFPLMWTIPLALYLTSFVLTFGPKGESRGRLGERMLRVLLVPAALVLLVPNALWLNVALPLALLTVAAIAAHGKVYSERPGPESLTHFYLWVSIGGAAGGLFASLVAPVVFDFVIEYPLGLALAVLLTGTTSRSDKLDPRIALGVALAGVAVSFMVSDTLARLLILAATGFIAMAWTRRPWTAAVFALMLVSASTASGFQVVASERTFFGVYRVLEFEDARVLMSGTTSHGIQLKDESSSGDPVFYYHEDGPVGDVFSALPQEPRDVGIIGLGVGGLTPYARQGDTYTYYEIDPVVEEIARDTRYFTLLAEGVVESEVIIGDGRLELERLDPTHDLLVVDAFASDAIPLHLLTLEAFETYLASIEDGGSILVHISNRHLNLEPVIGRIAQELGASARVMHYSPAEGTEWAPNSVWLLFEPQPALDLPAEWVAADVGESLWTDDFSNIVSVIEWGLGPD